MKHEWHQTDYLLEDCTIHGYRITEIPTRQNYGIKRIVYPNINRPEIFPQERNITHSISNYTLRNQNYDYPYNINDYSNQISQNEIENQRKYINNYRLKTSGSDGDFADNYSFYISGTSRLKPRVTINNKRAEYNCKTPNPYYFNYNDNIGRQRTIMNNYNNSNNYLTTKNRGYDICNTESVEEYNNSINNKRRNYYLTPNYYNNNDEEEGINMNLKNYHLSRNSNNQNIIGDNMYERRIVTENNEIPLKRRIINGYKNNINYNYKMENIRHVNITRNERNKRNENEQAINIRKSYKNNGYLIHSGIKKYYVNNYNTTKECNNKALHIIQNITNNIKRNAENNKIKMTNLNNHKFYISKNNEEYIQNKNNRTIIQQNPIKKSKYYLDKINNNINEKKDSFNKTNIMKDKNLFINDINIFNNKNKNDYSLQFIKDKLKNKNKIIIKPKPKQNKPNNTENILKLPKEQNEKIEQHIEKYYDSQGNCIGGKNVIIKRKYKHNGEKIVKEVIKESYKPNFKEIFKKHIPKKEEEENEERKEVQKENDNYFQYLKNCDKSQKKENLGNSINNNIEEKNEEMRNVTFGIKSQSIRFEEETKEEKEANEQQIMVNSEFEDDKNDENKIIINNDDKKDSKDININSNIDGNNINDSIKNYQNIKANEETNENIEKYKDELKKDSNKEEIKEDIKSEEIKNDNIKEEIRNDMKGIEMKEDIKEEEIFLDDCNKEGKKDDINKEEIKEEGYKEDIINNIEVKIEEKIDKENIDENIEENKRNKKNLN